MATAAQRAVSVDKPSEAEKIVGFSPERLRAPFALRCAALCIDYIVLLAFPAGWLATGSLLGEGGSVVIGTPVWLVSILIFLINFLAFPLFRGQTVGKMLTGLTILNIDGTNVSIGGILMRNVIGYLLTILTVGIGFLISAVNKSGRSLHDFLAGTIVVHGRKTQLRENLTQCRQAARKHRKRKTEQL